MLQIRNSIFETNSSSANVLIIPKCQGIHVPNRFIYVDDETSLKTSEKVIYSIIHGWRSDRETIDKLVNFLYISGVEEIIYGVHDKYFQDAVDKYKDHPEDMGGPDGWGKEVLKFAIFGTDTEIEHFCDGEDRPTYHGDSDDDNWYREYSVD